MQLLEPNIILSIIFWRGVERNKYIDDVQIEIPKYKVLALRHRT